MLKYQLLHPEILRGLGEAGHGAQVLVADGNYPLVTRSYSGARRVYLNLAPDLVRVTDVLRVLSSAIPIEAAQVMQPESGDEPPVFAEFRTLLPGMDLQLVGRFEFYDAARGPDLALAIATGECRIYANILLTIGVVPARVPSRASGSDRMTLLTCIGEAFIDFLPIEEDGRTVGFRMHPDGTAEKPPAGYFMTLGGPGWI